MLLFLYPINENGDATGKAVPAFGKFLEDEVNRIGGPLALKKALAPI